MAAVRGPEAADCHPEEGVSFFLRRGEEAGRKERDRRWRERGRGDGGIEGFIISSWSRVRSSWPGDLLRSQPLTLLPKASLCFFCPHTLSHAVRTLIDFCCCVMQLFHFKIFTFEAILCSREAAGRRSAAVGATPEEDASSGRKSGRTL